MPSHKNEPSVRGFFIRFSAIVIGCIFVAEVFSEGFGIKHSLIGLFDEIERRWPQTTAEWVLWSLLLAPFFWSLSKLLTAATALVETVRK